MAATIAANVSLDPRAEIDDLVEIGPFCVIGPHVRIGQGTRLENNVTLIGYVAIGCRNHVYPGVVIGGAPKTSATAVRKRRLSSAATTPSAKTSRSTGPASGQPA